MRESSPAPSNVLELSVSELSGKLKRTVEDTFGHVRVRGEISGYRGPHASGHAYFALKDERARLEAVIWRGVAAKLKHLPQEGLEVIASGKLTTYPGSSKYQIVIDGLEPAGAGALMALLQERKKKLGSEGLFDEAGKQKLPFLPTVIGVVTSPTGAVIRDVLHRLKDRFGVRVLVWPVRVQGEGCGEEVARAILGFNRLGAESPLPRPDLLIVARGGGSIEDLWGFNEEIVVRAAAASAIPLISAVGHETDWTLIDLAADRRAPTPTGAAEMAVPVRAELEARLATLGARLQNAVGRLFDIHRNDLRAAIRGLATPDAIFELPRRRLDEAAGRMVTGLQLNVRTRRGLFERCAARLSTANLLQQLARQGERVQSLQVRRQNAFANLAGRRESHLQQAARMLASLSYKGTLARGFAVVKSAGGEVLTRADAVEQAGSLVLEMRDGSVAAEVGAKDGAAKLTPLPRPVPSGKSSRKSPKSPKPLPGDDGQGQLF